MSTKAVILVGGDTRGTRFRPISLSVPKVLFPAGEKSLLAHAVDAAIAQPNVSEILLIGFYENSVFDNFLAQVNREHPDMPVKYLREYKAMGTAGGLYHFRDQILRGKPERLFVINADVCSSYPLTEITAKYDESKANGVILGTRVAKGIAANYGAIIADDDNKVLHYVEKPEESVSTLVNGGIYLLDVSVFDVIAQAKRVHNDEHAGYLEDEEDEDKLSLEQDVFPQLADGGKLYVYQTESFWRQVKEAHSALVANLLYLEDSGAKNAVYVDPSAKIDPSAKLGPNVTVCEGAKIGPGVRVRDAIILPRAEVRANAVVINAIVCSGSRIGRWARVEGSPISISSYESTVIKDGVKVPRVAIVAHDVQVADEVHLQNSVVLPHKDIRNDVRNEIVM